MLTIHMSELMRSHGYKAHYITDRAEAFNLFKRNSDRERAKGGSHPVAEVED